MKSKSTKGKSFPKKPVEFGTFLVEYRDSKDGMLHFLKERIDTIDEAQAAIDKLLQQGAHELLLERLDDNITTVNRS